MVWATGSAVNRLLQSLGVKLVLAFFVVAMIGIALMVASAYWATTREFDRFLWDQNQAELEEGITAYFMENGSLEGLDLAASGLAEQHLDTADGEFTPRGFQIADAEGNIIFPPGNPDFPDQVRTINLERAVPVEHEGEAIAYIKIPENPMARGPAELAFLQRARSMFLYGAGAAVLVALALGILLARQLVRPLREMNTATQAVAEGDLELRVQVRSHDEIGRLAESFNRMNERLAEARDQRRQLTADVAHELRTPLSIILGHAEAAADGVIPLTCENAAVILDEAERLDRLVEDLRVLSLSDASALTYSMVKCPVVDLINRVCRAYLPLAARKDVSLDVHIQEGVSPVHVDPDRMTQVLNNLISNALRYAPQNSRITLEAAEQKEIVQIVISDQGPGIPEGDLERIFHRFFRVDKSRQRREGGSGLGLAIARQIVEQHSGRLFARNVEGGGTSFVIELPGLDGAQTE